MQIGWENNRKPQTDIYFPLLYKCSRAGSAGLVHRLRSPEFTGTQLLPAFCSTIPTVQPWSKMSFTHDRRKEEERRKEGAARTSQLSLVVPRNYPKHYFFVHWSPLTAKEVTQCGPHAQMELSLLRERGENRYWCTHSLYTPRVILATVCCWLLIWEMETMIVSPIIKLLGTWNDSNRNRGAGIVSDM